MVAVCDDRREDQSRRGASTAKCSLAGNTLARVSAGVAIAVGAVIGLTVGIVISLTTDVPFASEIGLVLGALAGWLWRRERA